MLVIHHRDNKSDALRMSRKRAISAAKALNKRNGTIAWGWTYKPVRASLLSYVVIAHTRRGDVFGYFSGSTLVT